LNPLGAPSDCRSRRHPPRFAARAFLGGQSARLALSMAIRYQSPFYALTEAAKAAAHGGPLCRAEADPRVYRCSCGSDPEFAEICAADPARLQPGGAASSRCWLCFPLPQCPAVDVAGASSGRRPCRRGACSTGDGAITPAISVLMRDQGPEVSIRVRWLPAVLAADHRHPDRAFSLQKKGGSFIGNIVGPVRGEDARLVRVYCTARSPRHRAGGPRACRLSPLYAFDLLIHEDFTSAFANPAPPFSRCSEAKLCMPIWAISAVYRSGSHGSSWHIPSLSSTTSGRRHC